MAIESEQEKKQKKKNKKRKREDINLIKAKERQKRYFENKKVHCLCPSHSAKLI